MATIKDMVYDFKLEAERIDSKTVKTLKVPQIISLLNKGMLLLVKRRYDLDPKRRQSFESNQRRTQELQKIHILKESLEPVKNPNNTSTYRFDLTKTTKKFLFMTRASFFGSKGECTKQLLFGAEMQTDDYQVVMDNPDTDPSFEWRTVPYRYGADHLSVETDGTFIIENAEVDYLRYPVQMDIEGYTRFDGKPSKNIDCELPEFLHPDIVSMSAMLFKLWNGSPDAQATIMSFDLTE